MRLTKLIVLTLLLTRAAICQFSNTVYQTLASGITGTGVPSFAITAITTGTATTTYTVVGLPAPFLLGQQVQIRGITGAGCTALNSVGINTTTFSGVSPYSFTTAQNSSGCAAPGLTGAVFNTFITNIGQTQHEITVIYTNAPAHTCTTPADTGVFQASTGPDSFFIVPVVRTSLVNVVGGIATLYLATGNWPFMRFNLTAFDNTNCVAAAFYVGTLYPFSLIGNSTGGSGGGSMNPPSATCPHQAPVTLPAMAGALVRVATGTAAQITFVCHLDFSASAATDIQIVEGTTVMTPCDTGAVNVTGVYISVLTFAQDYSTTSPLHTLTAGDDLCISSSAGGTGGGVILYSP